MLPMPKLAIPLSRRVPTKGGIRLGKQAAEWDE